MTLELLNEFKRGIAAPSANHFGELSPTLAEHVEEKLGDSIACTLEGGPCDVGIESTIVSCLPNQPVQLLRSGHIQRVQLEDCIKQTVVTPNKPTINAPGQHHKHYAPNTPIQLLNGTEIIGLINKTISDHKNKKYGVIYFSKEIKNYLRNQQTRHSKKDAEFYAQHLYQWLHELDKENLCEILIESPPKTSDWDAIWDRLVRASF